MENQLTALESESLSMCEQVIDRGLNTFYEVGRALMQIRDQRLYRQMYGTFEDYCRKRWQFSSRYAQLLSGAVEVVDNLRTNGSEMPDNERQIRPLVPLEPEEQLVVWQVVQETAPNGKITSGHVKSVVTVLKELTATGAIDPGDGIEIPVEQATKEHLKAAVTEETYERMKRQETYIAQKEEHKNGKNGNGHLAPLMTSETPEWYTPDHIIRKVRMVLGDITLDPCSNSKTSPNVPALNHYTTEDNGLAQQWFGAVYMNPPYGDEIKEWVDKLVDEYELGNVDEAIALLPARTDTVWMRMLSDYPRCFVWGRLKFSGSENSAPFPSVVVYLGKDINSFAATFCEIGDTYVKWGV